MVDTLIAFQMIGDVADAYFEIEVVVADQRDATRSDRGSVRIPFLLLF